MTPYARNMLCRRAWRLPGVTVLLAPGVYRGFSLRAVSGTPEAPITISALDPEEPLIFTGIGEGAKLSSVAYYGFPAAILHDLWFDSGLGLVGTDGSSSAALPAPEASPVGSRRQSI